MRAGPAEIFKVLGVDTRVRIIELLKSKGPLGTKRIASILRITPAAVSQHLKVLRHAHLVTNERDGYWIPYSINEEALEKCRCTLEAVCSCGCTVRHASPRRHPKKTSLASLEKYERELKKELQDVRQRIAQIKAKKE